MVTITIKGMDVYHIINKTRDLHPALISLYKIKDEDLLFYAEDGFVIHNGVEQTSFVLFVYIDADIKYKNIEKEVTKTIKKILSDTAIHFYFRFTYKNKEDEILIKDPSYPLYMKDDNVVKVEHIEEEEEPYMGNIIAEYEEYASKNPNASAKELYENLLKIDDKHR